MSKIQILRTLSVKARVTEGLKHRLANEVEETIQQLDSEVQQLDAALKRAQLTGAAISPQQQMELRRAVEMEKQKRAAEKQELLERVRQVSDLPLGSEILQGQVQSLAEVGEGDDWESLFATEILVEDGKVVSIRKGGAVEPPPAPGQGPSPGRPSLIIRP